MSEDPKKKKPASKPKPVPELKPQEIPSSQFAEVRASQQTSSGINPEHMKPGYAGSLSQAEYDYKLNTRLAQTRDVFGKKDEHWGASSYPGSGIRRGANQTPATTPSYLINRFRRNIGSWGSGVAHTADFEKNVNEGLREMRANNLARQTNSLGGLRAIMIQRMNQLRGGG